MSKRLVEKSARFLESRTSRRGSYDEPPWWAPPW